MVGGEKRMTTPALWPGDYKHHCYPELGDKTWQVEEYPQGETSQWEWKLIRTWKNLYPSQIWSQFIFPIFKKRTCLPPMCASSTQLISDALYLFFSTLLKIIFNHQQCYILYYYSSLAFNFYSALKNFITSTTKAPNWPKLCKSPLFLPCQEAKLPPLSWNSQE